MKVHRLNVLLRLGSMVLDHFLMSIIMCLIVLPFGLLNLFQIVSHSPQGVSDSITGLSDRGDLYLFLFVVALYVCKDCVNGRSLAKRVLKMQVVNAKNNQAASPFQCIVRNLLIPLWPVEVVFTLVTPDRRLGDRIAGTKVIAFEKRPTEFSFERS